MLARRLRENSDIMRRLGKNFDITVGKKTEEEF
jgi:hypothetical protein